MNESDQLKILKINLLITTDNFDDSLLFFIKSAKALLKREGIDEPIESNEYDSLVIGYAGFLYNVRRNQDGSNSAELPRYLRYAINTYKYNQALNGGD